MIWLKKGLDTPERREQGLVLILPGIEGRSIWNASIANGLAQVGIPYAMRIWDWTTGWPIPLYHLVSWQRNLKRADLLAIEMTNYQQAYPGRPIFLIGHSGGGALSLLTLARLPENVSAEAAILLAPAISPAFDARPALNRTRRGVWNFCSRGDLFFLGLGTSLLGTLDRQHVVSAGLIGFEKELDLGDGRQLRNIGYRSEFFRDWHWGGHFGCVAGKFVGRWIAPILRGEELPGQTARKAASASAEELSSLSAGCLTNSPEPS